MCAHGPSVENDGRSMDTGMPLGHGWACLRALTPVVGLSGITWYTMALLGIAWHYMVLLAESSDTSDGSVSANALLSPTLNTALRCFVVSLRHIQSLREASEVLSKSETPLMR